MDKKTSKIHTHKMHIMQIQILLNAHFKFKIDKDDNKVINKEFYVVYEFVQ